MTDFLSEPSEPAGTEQLREGHDFCNQGQLSKLLSRRQTSLPHSDKPTNSTRLLVAKLTAAVLDEVQMFEYTGLLPGGSWSQQPAWRCELWRSYWQIQLSEQYWLNCNPRVIMGHE